jgi:hypothetical protein
MSGLAQLVPYFECQYPTVVPGNSIQIEQAAAAVPVNSGGVGDYVDPFAWPIPQYLTPGNNKGLGCMCGGSCCGGMGDVQLTAPGGLFTGDASDWGIMEWGMIAAGIYVVFSLVGDAKKHGRKARAGARAYRSAK